MTPERLAALVDAARELDAIATRIHETLKAARALAAIDPHEVSNTGNPTTRDKE